MEDVISKLPGMTVDEAGTISWQGKKVDKVLVDDKDVLVSGYGSVLRNLSPDFASSVELLQNYSEGGVMSKRTGEGKLAINLRSTKASSLALRLEAGGGWEEKWATRASLLRVRQPLSLCAIANGNNTNQPVFSVMDYINAWGGLESLTSSDWLGKSALSLGGWEQGLVRQTEDEYDHGAGIGNLNLTLTSTDHYTLSLGTLCHFSTSHTATESEETYSGEDFLTNHAIRQGKDNSAFTSLIARQKWELSSSVVLQAFTKVDYGNTNRHSEANDAYADTLSTAWDERDADMFSLSQQISINALTGKSRLQGGVDFTLQQQSEDIEALSPIGLPDTFLREGAFYTSEQEVHNWGLSGFFAWDYPLPSSQLRMRTALKAAGNFCHLDSHYGSSLSEEKLHSSEASLFVGLMKSEGRVRFDAGTWMAAHNADAKLAESNNFRGNTWRVEPFLSVSLHLSQRHILSLTCRRSTTTASLDDLSRASNLSAYNAVQSGSLLTDLFEDTWRGQLTYQYFNLFSGTSLFVYGLCERTTGCRRPAYASQGIITYEWWEDGGERQSANLSLYACQGLFNRPMDLKVQASYGYTLTDMLQESVPMDLCTHTLDASLAVATRFKSSPVNVSVKGRFQRADNRISLLSVRTTRREWGGELALTYVRGSFTASLTGKAQRVTNGSAQRNLLDTDFLICYHLGKWQLKASGEDVFHLDGKFWLTEQVTPTMRSYQLYRQHAGHLLVSACYTL